MIGMLTKTWTKTALLGVTFAILWGCEKGGQEGKILGTKEPKEQVRVSGSASALPLVRLLAHEFERFHPDVRIAFLPGTHTKGGVAGVHEADLDIGVVSRTLNKDELSEGVQYLHLALDGIVFATHRNVRIENVSSQQLRQIYSGKITNWRQLGGENKTINVLDRPGHTSPKIVLRNQLFGKDMDLVRTATVLERPSQMSASLEAIPYSIGYTSLGEVISSDLDVNVLNVDGIPAIPSHVEKNLYRFSRPFGMVIHSAPGRDVMKFVSFIYSDAGEKIIESNGYTPVLSHFVIATIPERNIIRQEERYRPLVDYLARKLGIQIKISLRHLSSYRDIVDEFVGGHVNAAFFGSFVYALTRSRVEVEPIARPVKDGVSQYRGLIFVRKDSGIKDWRDLKGRSFAMIRATTAGEIFPKMFFENHGVENLEDFLGKIHYVGSHDVSVLKVLYGEIEAGAAKDLIYEKLAREDPSIEREMIILARSAPVPENALVVRQNIDFPCLHCHQRIGKAGPQSPYSDDKGRPVDFKKRLREILLSLSETKEGRAVLRKFGADRFIETTDSDYDELYRMIVSLGMDLEDYPYGEKQ